MAQKYKISLELRDKTRQNIRENNQHYIICTANDLLGDSDYLISNEFPTNQIICGYLRDFERQKRKQNKLKQKRLGKGIDLKKSDAKRLGEILGKMYDNNHKNDFKRSDEDKDNFLEDIL